jgi:hypothetical protein
VLPDDPARRGVCQPRGRTPNLPRRSAGGRLGVSRRRRGGRTGRTGLPRARRRPGARARRRAGEHAKGRDPRDDRRQRRRRQRQAPRNGNQPAASTDPPRPTAAPWWTRGDPAGHSANDRSSPARRTPDAGRRSPGG